MPLAEAREISDAIRSRVGILPGVLVDLVGTSGDRAKKRGCLNWENINRLGRSLREVRDTRGVPIVDRVGFVRESWLGWGLGGGENTDPRPPEIVVLTAHDVRASTPRKAQQQLSTGELVNCVRLAAHVTTLHKVPEPNNPLGEHKTRILAKGHRPESLKDGG